MCVLRAEPAAATVRRRLRLWELPPSLHCAILGTCLSFADLVKTGRKAGIAPEDDATDYEVHAWFVQRSCEPGNLSRLLHKRLDRTWRTAIDACRAARDEAELAAFWSRSLAQGDIPGPFWAAMTHPSATEDLRSRAYGDVHMLSHRMGTANRESSRRLQAAEAERGRLSDRLADARRRLAERETENRLSAERHARVTGALTERLQATEAAEARLREFERGEAYRALQGENAALAAALESTRRTLDARSREYGSLEREHARLRRAQEDTAARAREAESECAALEFVVRSGIAVDAEPGADAPAIDLCGRRIAYVGGRDGAVPHFRALVEKSNGRFCHHDGGVDDGAARLDRVLNQADVVLCPVDCVSHSACLKAKKFCRRSAKTFVPLRSASLSSLAAGLHRAIGGPGMPEGRGGRSGGIPGA